MFKAGFISWPGEATADRVSDRPKLFLGGPFVAFYCRHVKPSVNSNPSSSANPPSQNLIHEHPFNQQEGHVSTQ
jgi:hypothetical protein